MGPKYEFTDETKTWNGRLLHQIRRLSDRKLGGWIEKEENLSQEGSCFVYNDAKVYDDAKISGNAEVNDHARVYDNAQVYGNAVVCEYTQVYNNARVYGKVEVYGSALVCGNAKVYDNAQVYDKAWVECNAQVYNDAKVYNCAIIRGAEIYGDAEVYGNAQVYGNAKVYDDADVRGNAKVYNNAKVYGDALVSGNAKVYDNAQVYDKAWVGGNAQVYGDTKVFGNTGLGLEINSEEYNGNKEDSSKEVIQDFIYKVDDSDKITTQTAYDSIEEFFSEPIKNDVKLDTLVICAVDTKDTLIKLQKVETDDKTEFKFIVDITNEDGEDFIFRSIIKSQEHLNQLIQQTIDMLKQSPQFTKYVDDLENCL